MRIPLQFISYSAPDDTADQCRELGIVVGETIEGREEWSGGWDETRLTLLWLGESVAVWREVSRNYMRPEWSEPIEACAWTLDCRPWFKVGGPGVDIDACHRRDGVAA